MACMDPRGTVGSIYKGEYYTLVHTTYESSGPYGFREEDFLDQWNYRGTLDFLVYRAGNVDTLVTNDISISQLGIEIFRSEK